MKYSKCEDFENLSFQTLKFSQSKSIDNHFNRNMMSLKYKGEITEFNFFAILAGFKSCLMTLTPLDQ